MSAGKRPRRWRGEKPNLPFLFFPFIPLIKLIKIARGGVKVMLLRRVVYLGDAKCWGHGNTPNRAAAPRS